MKIKIVFTLLLFVSLSVFGQESTLDKVSKETCEFLNSDEVKSLPNDEKTLKLGLYILNLYAKYKKDLEKEGVILDLSKGEEGGSEFGQKVGVNMVRFCPDALIALASEELDKIEEEDESEKFIEGIMSSVKGEEINTVTVKDISGKSQKFLWISNFKGSDRLIDYKKLKKQKVKIYYKNIEVFSPKLEEYIIRKQITRIDYL